MTTTMLGGKLPSLVFLLVTETNKTSEGADEMRSDLLFRREKKFIESVQKYAEPKSSEN
jgi:hypothetical protein